MRTLRALSALLAAIVIAGSATIPDPQGFGVRGGAGLLLLVLGAMAVAGHLVPLRRPGLVAGAAALLGGAAMLVRIGAGLGLVLGIAILLAQALPLIAARRRRRSASAEAILDAP